MDRVETLRKIKEAEARAAEMRKEADAEKERILKEARRTELDLQERLRKEADDRYGKVMADARQAVAAEREVTLEKGRREAARIKSEGMGNFEAAVERLVGKFKGAVNA